MVHAQNVVTVGILGTSYIGDPEKKQHGRSRRSRRDFWTVGVIIILLSLRRSGFVTKLLFPVF
jgi:hypothetical protein